MWVQINGVIGYSEGRNGSKAHFCGVQLTGKIASWVKKSLSNTCSFRGLRVRPGKFVHL